MSNISKIALNNAEYKIESGSIKSKCNNSPLKIWQGTEYQWEHNAKDWYYWQTIETGSITSGNNLNFNSRYTDISMSFMSDNTFLL